MSKIFNFRDGELYAHHSIDLKPDPDQYTIHAHEWMEIYYCLSGSGSYLVEGVLHPLSAGDVFIMGPGEMHKLQIDPSAPYERIALHFSPDLLDRIGADKSLLRPFTERPLGQNNRYTPDLDPSGKLRAAFDNFTFGDIPNMKLNLVSRLVMFLTCLEGQYLSSRHLFEAGNDNRNQLVSYVNQHLFENISVQSVADAFYLSRSQINRIFRQDTGTSLWKYVTIKRLLAARAMIERGESSGEAAAACGFTEYSSFFRAYKGHFGHSPKEDQGK